jgi:hypothetical protein
VKLKKKVDTRGPPTNFFIDKVLWRGEEKIWDFVSQALCMSIELLKDFV